MNNIYAKIDLLNEYKKKRFKVESRRMIYIFNWLLKPLFYILR